MKMKLKSLAFLVLTLSVALGLAGNAEAQGTFVVNTTVHPGDGLCDEAECTLIEAMEAANTAAGVDTILFNIEGDGPFVIQPDPWLPIVSDAVVIDGYSQPGSALASDGSPAVIQIEIDGSAAAADVHGIEIETDDAWIRGLAVNRFARSGILIIGSNNVVEGCYLGTSLDGSEALGNGFESDDDFLYDGIWIAEGSGNRIGGADAGQANLLSGNANSGVYVSDSENMIVGNLIGSDAQGRSAVPNEGPGITVFGADRNTIRDNLISGNVWFGVDIFDENEAAGPVENIVAGNRIGTDRDGTTRLGNRAGGILVNGSENIIGGAEAEKRNLVSGNDGSGIVIFDPEGPVTSRSNVVVGNWIGLDATGADTLGNSGDGIRVVGAGNRIGGPEEADRNVISGNLFAGVSIRGDQSADSVGGNLIQGNWIGTDLAGERPLGNIEDGVAILGSADNEVTGNVMTANFAGVYLVDPGSQMNLVNENLIGTNAEGVSGLQNDHWGIEIREASSSTVIQNLISFNLAGGVGVVDEPAAGKRERAYGSKVVEYRSGRGVVREIPMSAPGRERSRGVAKSAADPGEGNAIYANRMQANGPIGIDLGQDGRSTNDDGDADEGPNRLQNFPVISSAMVNGTQLSVSVSVTTDTANASYPLTIHVYNADDEAQGDELIGEFNYEGNVAGTEFVGTISLEVPISDGDRVVATATDAEGNTSEFSDPVPVTGSPVSVEDRATPADDFALRQNYPNPFGVNARVTHVAYTLSQSATVTISVFDALGRLVAEPVSRVNQPRGEHGVDLEASDFASGVYTVVLQAGANQAVRQMTVVR